MEQARVLITGFEPFGTTPTNPAQATAEALDGATVEGAEVVGRVVPARWFKCIDAVMSAIAECSPTHVVMCGEYGGRSMITTERIAQNVNDSARYGIADNDGLVLEDTETVPGGPVGYYSTLPIRAMVLAIRAAGVPADISDTGGTLMCNHLMYGVLHHIAVEKLDVRAGWIHLPHLPEVAALDDNLGHPSMSLDTAVRGVSAAVGAIATHPVDVHEHVHSLFQI
ncbi:MAG: pyroglutamyl-peptidase I [Actinomycetota bacterium]